MNNLGLFSHLKLVTGDNELLKTMGSSEARRGDRVTYQQVGDIAKGMVEQGAGTDIMDRDSLTAELKRESVDPAIGNNASVNYGNAAQNDRIESYQAEVAHLRDEISLLRRDLSGQGNGNNAAKPPATSGGNYQTQYAQMTRQIDNNLNEGTARYPAKSSPCYYCLENGHLIANCDHKEHHIRIGWIQIDKGGFMRLGDGTALPRYPSDMSRRDRVEKYYNRLGQTVARQEERMRTLIQG